MKSAPATTAADRILSLDVLRGLTMGFMVLVGNPGSNDIYPQLDHAQWHGFTITDLVFPTFLWVVGFSVQISFTRQLSKGRRWSDVMPAMLKRCLLLFVLGIALYAISDWHLASFRIMGVLQRIALCSLAVSLLFPLPLRQQVLVLGCILSGYALVLRYIPAPGYAAGDLSIEGNIAHFVDRVLLGHHNYSGTGDWDPEGILSTLPAIASTLFGMLAAKVLQRYRSNALYLLLPGVLLTVSGVLLGQWQPINKKLWTPAFCLLTAGIDFVIFPLLYWWIDQRGHRTGLLLPLAFGQNALGIYLLTESISAMLYRTNAHDMIFRTLFAGHTTPRGDSLLYAFCFLALVSTLAVLAHRKRYWLKL